MAKYGVADQITYIINLARKCDDRPLLSLFLYYDVAKDAMFCYTRLCSSKSYKTLSKLRVSCFNL